MEQEAAGIKYSEAKQSEKPKKGKKRTHEDEEKELKKIMMTNKQRKLYNKMQYGIQQKEARSDNLAKKKKKLDKTKQELKNLDK